MALGGSSSNPVKFAMRHILRINDEVYPSSLCIKTSAAFAGVFPLPRKGLSPSGSQTYRFCKIAIIYLFSPEED
jgi:hypothetical protein